MAGRDARPTIPAQCAPAPPLALAAARPYSDRIEGVRVAVTGGGTGGHVYPALAVIEEIEKKSGGKLDVIWIGTKRKEAEILPRFDIPLFHVDISPPVRSLSVPALAHNVKFALNLLSGRSYRQARRHLFEFKPDLLIATGGYVAYPACHAASALGIPLFLIEPNIVPGLVTRRVGRFARKVYCAAGETAFALGLAEICEVVGVPVRSYTGKLSREDLLRKFGLEPVRITILVTGGSTGAEFVNRIVETEVFGLIKSRKDLTEHVQVLHQTGTAGIERARGLSRKLAFPYRPLEYIEDSTEALFVADVFIGRSGASSVAEALHFGLPAIYIPYVHHRDAQQVKNAAPYAEIGIACIHAEKNWSGQAFRRDLTEFVEASRNPGLIERIRECDKKAAERIAESILSDLGGRMR